MDDKLTEIERLVRETFDLWDMLRVGFRWRHYSLNHTYRVTNLSVSMSVHEGADPYKLRCAGILHDITKPYDGEIKMAPNGERVTNEDGFWLNDTLLPSRSNWVIELYDRLNLHGQIHHESGATVAEQVLREVGYPESDAREIGEIVRGHLKPADLTFERASRIYRLPETRLLYDADTIDPNLGLTAFYRNIQITMGRYLKSDSLPDLKEYVERVASWLGTKDSFIEQLLTATGREVGEGRQARMREVSRQLLVECDNLEMNRTYGLLGVVEFLQTDAHDPSLRHHAERLRSAWLSGREVMLSDETRFSKDAATESLARAQMFSDLLDKEIAGEL